MVRSGASVRIRMSGMFSPCTSSDHIRSLERVMARYYSLVYTELIVIGFCEEVPHENSETSVSGHL